MNGIQVCDIDLSKHIISLDKKTDLLIESLRGDQLAWLIHGARRFYDIILVDLPARSISTNMVNVFATSNYFLIPFRLGSIQAVYELLRLEERIQGFIFNHYPVEFGKIIPFLYYRQWKIGREELNVLKKRKMSSREFVDSIIELFPKSRHQKDSSG